MIDLVFIVGIVVTVGTLIPVVLQLLILLVYLFVSR